MVRFITVTCISCCLYFLLPSLKYLTNALMQKKSFIFASAFDTKMQSMIVWPQKHEVAGHTASHSVDNSSVHSLYPLNSMCATHMNLWVQFDDHPYSGWSSFLTWISLEILPSTHSYLCVYQGIRPVKFTMENTQRFSVLLMGIFEYF